LPGNWNWSTTRTKIPFKECTIDDFALLEKDDIISIDLAGMYCLKSDIVLSGSYDEDHLSYFTVLMKKCNNSDLSENISSCQSPKEISNFFTEIDKYLTVLEPNLLISAKNYPHFATHLKK
jgi:hypothetical protein